MKQLQLLFSAYILDSLIRHIQLVEIVVVGDILLVQFFIQIHVKKPIGRQLFVSIAVHPECILTEVVSVIKTNVDVRNVANLVFG